MKNPDIWNLHFGIAITLQVQSVTRQTRISNEENKPVLDFIPPHAHVDASSPLSPPTLLDRLPRFPTNSSATVESPPIAPFPSQSAAGGNRDIAGCSGPRSGLSVACGVMMGGNGFFATDERIVPKEIVRGGLEEEEGAGADIHVDHVTVEMVGNESRFRLRLWKLVGLDGGRCNGDWGDGGRCNSDRCDDSRCDCGNHCNGNRYGGGHCKGGRCSDAGRCNDAGHCEDAGHRNGGRGNNVGHRIVVLRSLLYVAREWRFGRAGWSQERPPPPVW